MTKDALKFFHAYINEMIDVGGENLPKAVSTKLGSKLGAIYKKRGYNELIPALKQIYKVLGGKTSIKKIGDNTYNVLIKHSKKYCPIGGKKNPEQAEIIQESICYPYTKSFLVTLFPNLSFEAEIKQCLLSSESNKHCRYILKTTLKNNQQ